MKIFIDSADIEEIREANALGVIDGVTTNPSLVAKTGRPFAEALAEICAEVDGPISAEVVSTEAEAMVAEGRRLAARVLSAEGIAVNMTLIFQPAQGLLAAKAGASYLSPFVGRLDDISEDGMAMVDTLVEILANYDYAAEVLVASIRNPLHFIEAARMGADVATCPLSVINQLAKHPLTDAGLAKFLADWEKVPG